MQAENQAALAALRAVWNQSQVHEPGQVPKMPPTPYAVVSVTAPGDTNHRSGGRSGSETSRIVAQVVGRNVTELSVGVDKCDAAFLGKRLQVTGRMVSPGRREVQSPIIRDPDGGVLLSVTLTYTFASSPA